MNNSMIYILMLVWPLSAIFSKECYRLTPPSINPGLFCVFNTVLGSLDYYEKGGCSGLEINFGEQGLYYDPEFGPNWWEYYFEPIKLGIDEDDSIKKFPSYKKTIFGLQGQFGLSRKRAHELISKYVKLKPSLQQKIDQIAQQEFKGHFMVGVHYRGTDKKKEAPKVSYQQAYLRINEELQRLPEKDIKIFLATDDGAFFTFLKDRYPTQLFGLDAIRSTNGKPIHIGDKKDHYRKGEEAIIDALLLAKCQLLIKTASNLSDCSIHFNPTIAVVHLNTPYYNQ